MLSRGIKLCGQVPTAGGAGFFTISLCSCACTRRGTRVFLSPVISCGDFFFSLSAFREFVFAPLSVWFHAPPNVQAAEQSLEEEDQVWSTFPRARPRGEMLPEGLFSLNNAIRPPALPAVQPLFLSLSLARTFTPEWSIVSWFVHVTRVVVFHRVRQCVCIVASHTAVPPSLPS